MRKSMSLFTILIISVLLQHQAAAASSTPKMQKLALFQFKLSLDVDQSSSDAAGCDSPYPKTVNWSMSSDSCTWDGVSCDDNTGDVIGLDLSCSQLSGPILPNTTLFHLSRLHSLNLASNLLLHLDHFFENIGLFAPGLTHLNLALTDLSEGNATGISNLSQLVSLDLSDSGGLVLETQLLELLLQNFTHLRILNLRGVHISSVLPMNLSTSLTHLYLRQTGLGGVVPEEVFHLPNLEVLDLSRNDNLRGNLPKVKWGSSSTLRMLDLGWTGLSGEIPDSISYLNSLTSLSLQHCSLSGPLPSNLTALSLSYLNYLNLRQNLLNGTIPSWLFDLPSLIELYIGNNLLYGTIPQSFSHLVNLTDLDLSSNNFSGVLDIQTFLSLNARLWYLSISDNSISLRNYSSTTIAPHNLHYLGLSSCNIKEFPHFLRATRNIIYLDLSNNQIEGEIPHWIADIGRESLNYLDLSNNQINGEIPHWIGDIGRESKFFYLNLSHNNLTGGFEHLPWNYLEYLDLHNNTLNGSLPASICKAYGLFVLNLSHNKVSGALPTCTQNLAFLSVFDLRMNNIEGHLPSTLSNFPQLESLNLHGNKLEGTIPPSFAEFGNLEVLDLGSNQISGTFPQHLEALPNLQVLILKSNHFHGSISNNSKIGHPFPSLRIIDLSYNDFSGPLPATYIKNFKAMMNGDANKMKLGYMGDSLYSDSTTLVIKGVETEFVRILTILTSIDLSENKFKGEIPEDIGNLVSLRYLNLSHNHLTGHIPSSIPNLSMLESLDLSSNRLEGEIPQELTSVTSLSHLNLSENQLRGHIPQGNQFDTFDNDSYIGNLALCGHPLSKECERDSRETGKVVEEGEDDDNFFSGFTWKAVVIGYGSGVVLGFSIGYLMFMVGKPKWFVGIIAIELGLKVKRLEIRTRKNWN